MIAASTLCNDVPPPAEHGVENAHYTSKKNPKPAWNLTHPKQEAGD